MAKSKMMARMELFAKWAAELKPGESLTVFAKITENAVTLYNHAGLPLTRACGGGYDRAGACLETLFKRLPGGQGNADLLGWCGASEAELPQFQLKRVLTASSLWKIPVSVWTITRK